MCALFIAMLSIDPARALPVGLLLKIEVLAGAINNGHATVRRVYV
jgi:hypothetical protein